MQQLHVEEKGFAAAKTLYISDSVDKRKHFDLYCKVCKLHINFYHLLYLNYKYSINLPIVRAGTGLGVLTS